MLIWSHPPYIWVHGSMGEMRLVWAHFAPILCALFFFPPFPVSGTWLWSARRACWVDGACFECSTSGLEVITDYLCFRISQSLWNVIRRGLLRISLDCFICLCHSFIIYGIISFLAGYPLMRWRSLRRYRTHHEGQAVILLDRECDCQCCWR